MKRTLSGGSQIKWGAVLSYIAIFANIIAMLLYTPWMKNQIGVENYGLYTLALSCISLFMMDFGIGAATTRFVAKYRAEGNEKAVNDLLGLVYKLYLLIDIIICVALLVIFFFLESIYAGLTSEELMRFKQLYVIVSVFSLFSFPFAPLSGVLNAYEKYVPLKLCDMANKFLGILLVVCVLLCGLGLRALVLANSLAGIVTICAKWYFVRRITPTKPNWKVHDTALVKAVAGFSIWSFINGLAQRLIYNIAPSILAAVTTSYQIALYSPASAIAGYFFSVASAINGMFLPVISRKIAAHKEDDILPLMITVGRFQVVVLGLLYVGFWTIGKEFMILWMGEEFAPSYYCVLLLAFPTIFEYSQQIAGTTLVAKGKVHISALCLLGSGAVNLLISPWLSAAYGVYGVSIAIVVVAMLNLAVMNVFYHKVLHIPMFRFYKECYLPILIPLVAGIVLSGLTASAIPVGGWTGMTIKGIAATMWFLLLVWLFHLRKEERTRVLMFLRKRGRKGG